MRNEQGDERQKPPEIAASRNRHEEREDKTCAEVETAATSKTSTTTVDIQLFLLSTIRIGKNVRRKKFRAYGLCSLVVRTFSDVNPGHWIYSYGTTRNGLVISRNHGAGKSCRLRVGEQWEERERERELSHTFGKDPLIRTTRRSPTRAPPRFYFSFCYNYNSASRAETCVELFSCRECLQSLGEPGRQEEEPSDHGTCGVCGKSAALRCSGCRIRFYCDKDHQRNDWAKHKTCCRSWEVRESKELGRHLIATRDLVAGDFVVSETPIVWGPSPHMANVRRCVGCGDRDPSVRCPGCNWFVCRVSCDGLVDENRHRIECGFLAKSRIIPRCDILLALRILILRRRSPKRWATLSALQSHEESRGPGTEAHEEVEIVARHLAPLLALDPSSREVLPKVCGLIDVNALETNPPEGSAAIYETVCLLEHSCVANTRHSFTVDAKGRPRITVRTVTSVKKGEHLSTMYTHALWSTRARREHLLVTKYFTCRCERCVDPTELGSHLGTLKCLCGSGLVLPNDPLDPESEWSCTTCPGRLAGSEAAQLIERIADDVEAAMGVARKDTLGDLYSRLNVLLHPGHQHCIAVGHSLMQLLAPEDPLKTTICKRIIETTSILDPQGARLPLYTAVALRELANCPGQERNVLLERAANLLRFEPPNSPGEELARLIATELTT